MIYPQKNKLIRWFFHNYILRIVAQNFEQVNFNNIAVDQSRSVLLIANHFSWWDGFLLYYINHRLLKKQFHIMVLEETVKKVGFFKYLGAFSVSKGSRDALKSIDYAAGLLHDPDNLVLIFPQGKLHSNFVNNISFQKGVARIAEKSGGTHQIILSATFVESLQYKKPTANVYLKTISEQISGVNVVDLQQAYQEHYKDALAQQTKLTV